MGALLGRCHDRITACSEAGTVIQPNQVVLHGFSVLWGAAYLCNLETFLLYFTYFRVKIFGRCSKKNKHGFFLLAVEGPVLLEYSKL